MNYTENYHLPQWEETDRIMRTDFNQMCENLEDGLLTVKEAADAAYAPGKLPYTVGSYVGNGSTITIELGFQPSFIIITGQTITTGQDQIRFLLIAGPETLPRMVSFQDNGFQVKMIETSSVTVPTHPKMNIEGKSYTYIAFQ